jgi:hypothetical protein
MKVALSGIGVNHFIVVRQELTFCGFWRKLIRTTEVSS